MISPTIRVCTALLLAILTDASSAAATTPGNLLISNSYDQTITEYTWDGQVVQRFDIALWEPELRFRLGDLVQAANGTIYAFSGDLDPALTSLNPKTGIQRNLPMPDISTYPAPGTIATKGNYLFLGDMENWSSPGRGIVRYNIDTGTTERFASGLSFSQLTIGGDGLLYAGSQTLQVYDPATMSLLRTVAVGDQFAIYAAPHTVAVDAQGVIYGATGDGRINKYSATGTLISSLQTQAQIEDIEVDAQGRIVMTTWDETVYTTDTSLSALHEFKVPTLLTLNMRVAFAVAPAVPEPSTYALMLAGIGAVGLAARRRRTADRIAGPGRAA
ncbi:PEPxxWA-CTERM sorting domain-containing protein [Mitsuaria sp. CC2]|uniref:PEP-CTERM sorting domain-containing protein n=1 Tax=Mitsuaria sp. CC2 TaxID=3029186 RepID=UPI003B8C49F7